MCYLQGNTTYGFDDLRTEEKRRMAWEKDKHKHYSVQWVDKNDVNYIRQPQAVNSAVVQVVGGPPQPPPPNTNHPTVIPTETGPVFTEGRRLKSLWNGMTGRT